MASDQSESTEAARALQKDHARLQFERWARGYDQSIFNELVFYPSIRACQEELYRWRAKRAASPLRMLDVGCGTGTLLAMTARDAGIELLVGLDYSPTMIRKAAEKAERLGLASKLRAVVGDAERLPFQEESFDVLTCCNSFHHYPHQARAVAEFRRVLRKGGLMVLIDGFRDNVIGWVIFDVFVEKIEKHVHHVSWSEARRLAEEAGFSQVGQRKLNVLAPLLVTTAIR
ncbi:MAG: class I SAM-dependent methyltransferase [Planctomycetes bacterium]|nr:class I SAM-dependent methyltransferase [Planctomycetota bacterium]